MLKLTELEGAQGTYSDLFKDVHGFRPRYASTEQWNSVAWLNEQITLLDEEMVGVLAEEERQEKENIVNFEAKVTEVISLGASSRAAALRWLIEAENDSYLFKDLDHFCYLMRLPFGYIKREDLI